MGQMSDDNATTTTASDKKRQLLSLSAGPLIKRLSGDNRENDSDSDNAILSSLQVVEITKERQRHGMTPLRGVGYSRLLGDTLPVSSRKKFEV